jgi:hypothetical protein
MINREKPNNYLLFVHRSFMSAKTKREKDLWREALAELKKMNGETVEPEAG